MTLIAILLILALIFGAGTVLEGIAWFLLITLLLVAVAAWFGWRKIHELRGGP